MSANNNREGDAAKTIDPLRISAEILRRSNDELERRLGLEKATEPTRTPHATPADVNMLWDAIDQLKARIDALEGRKAVSEDRFTMLMSMSPEELRRMRRTEKPHD